MVYITQYDLMFVQWSMETADKVYLGMAMVVLALVVGNMNWKKMRVFGVAMIGTPVGLIAGLVSAGIVAGIMILFDKGLRW